MRVIAAVALLLLITACGQKGPLFKPGDDAPAGQQEESST